MRPTFKLAEIAAALRLALAMILVTGVGTNGQCAHARTFGKSIAGALLLMLASLALCAPQAVAQNTIITYAYVGGGFNVPLCLQYTPNYFYPYTVDCVAGDISGSLTLSLPYPKYTGSGYLPNSEGYYPQFSSAAWSFTAVGVTVSSASPNCQSFAIASGPSNLDLVNGAIVEANLYVGCANSAFYLEDGEQIAYSDSGSVEQYGVSTSLGTWSTVSIQTGGTPPLQITTTSVPGTGSGMPYAPTPITATGGSGRGYNWTITSGSLPSALRSRR